MAINGNNPSPDRHCEVLYRQTFNTLGEIVAAGLTQSNTTGNDQKKNNARVTNSNKGILGGSVVAVAGDLLIGPCVGDCTTADKAVGIAVNDALGNPFESSSAVASNKVVYLHGTGSVFRTDIYETLKSDGTATVTYNAGDFVYPSRNGLLITQMGLDNTSLIGTKITEIGIVLEAPASANNYFLAVQMRI